MELCLLFVLIFLTLLQCHGASKTKRSAEYEKKSFQCPVCIRVLRAARSLSKSEKSSSLSPSAALRQYCELSALGVEDAKFCYDISPMHQELTRLFNLGAEDERICRRVFAKNPDFCMTGRGSSSPLDDSKAEPTETEKLANEDGTLGSTSANGQIGEQKRGRVEKIHSETGTRRKGIIYI